jgi:hypothetical protein
MQSVVWTRLLPVQIFTAQGVSVLPAWVAKQFLGSSQTEALYLCFKQYIVIEWYVHSAMLNLNLKNEMFYFLSSESVGCGMASLPTYSPVSFFYL